MLGTKVKCKYCNLVDFVQVTEKECACTECGLLYLEHKSLKTDKVKFIAEEWRSDVDGRNKNSKIKRTC